MATVVLLGALDTKGNEYRFVMDYLVAAGVEWSSSIAECSARLGCAPM